MCLSFIIVSNGKKPCLFCSLLAVKVSRYTKIKEESFPMKQIQIAVEGPLTSRTHLTSWKEASALSANNWGLRCSRLQSCCKNLDQVTREERRENWNFWCSVTPGSWCHSFLPKSSHSDRWLVIWYCWTLPHLGAHWLISQPEIRRNVSCRVKSTLNWAG